MAKEKVTPGDSSNGGGPEKVDEMASSGKTTGDTAGKASGRPQDATTADPGGGATAGPGGSGKGAGGGKATTADEGAEQPSWSRPRHQHSELSRLLQTEEVMKRIAGSLPRHLTPERWISVLLTVNSGSPKLQMCSPHSILAAALQGAVLGLDFNKTLREAFLIPRRNEKKEKGPDGRPKRDDKGRPIEVWEATFMPGYAGLKKLVMNDGSVTNVRSGLVYESELTGNNGEFLYQFTPDLQFIHRPCLITRERGSLALTYAVAKLKTGEYVLEVMTIEEVEKSGHHRSSAYIYRKGQEEGPWVTDYDMMVRKTVLKRLCNQLPMSPEVAQAIDLDNKGYVLDSLAGQPPGRKALEQGRRGRGSQTLAERLGEIDPDDDDTPENNPQDPLDDGTSVDDTGAVEAS